MDCFRSLLLSLFIILFFAQTNNGQSLSITSVPNPPCVSQGTNITGTINVTSPPGGTGNYATWSSDFGSSSVSGGYTSATFTIWAIPSGNKVTFTVKYYNSSGSPIGGAHTIDLNVYDYENPFAEAHGPSTNISMLSTDGLFNLKSLLTIPSGYTGDIEFALTDALHTQGPYIINTGTSNTFDPSKASVLPSTYNVSYRLYWNGLCKSPWIPIVNSTIKVFDGSGALPYFIQAVSAVPICQNSTDLFYFDVLANCSFFCTMVPTYYNTTTKLTYNGAMQSASDYDIDPFNGLHKFRFHIDPALVNPNTFSIPIRVVTTCGQIQTGYIPIQLIDTLKIYGLPNPTVTGGNDINICSASLDTMFMQGGPGGGYFKIYKYTPAAPTPVLIAPSVLGSDLYPSYRNAGQDRSMQKIIPYELFRDYASNDPTTVFRVVYYYSKFTSGACTDSTIVKLNFLTPNSTDYTIIAPSSVATTPFLTYCYGDMMNLQIVGAPGNYTWYLSDGYIRQTTSTNFSYMFAEPGTYTIRLKSTSSVALPPGQCSNDVIRTIRVGAKPKADFKVFDNFIGSSTSFQSTAIVTKQNVTDASDDINTWKWSWGETTPSPFVNSAISSTTKTYNSLIKDPYEVAHVAISGWGCKDTAKRQIPIFPIKIPTNSNPVFYDFNVQANSLGWFESGQYKLSSSPLSSWLRMVPNSSVIKGTDSCWITSKVRVMTNKDTSGYFNQEKSWLESPCYDLSSIAMPMLSFDNWSQSDVSFDGATLEYAVCDAAFGEELWKPLGTMGEGKNWFNSNSIVSAPGGDPSVLDNLLGWTGTDNTKNWLASAYFLEDAKNKTSVTTQEGSKYIRFRIVFASNSDNTPKKIFDGFAFDNFFVGQRDRKVLIEEFCDYENIEPEFKDISFRKNPQLIKMQYHSRYHKLNDDINNQNKGEAGARNLLYGYSQLPRAAVDGYYSLDFDNKFFGNKGERNFYKRSLELSPFKIVINSPTVTGNELVFSVDMTRDTLLNNEGPFVLQVAVLEDSVVANGNYFLNVFRKFLPDASGQHVGKDQWPVHSTKTLNRSFTPFVALTPRANSSETSLIVVAFVQDEATSEVYQSEAIYVPYSVVQSLQPTPLPAKVDVSGVSITLYPNPAQNNLMVYFENGKAPEDYQYRMIDGFGKTVKSGQIPKDATDFTLYGLQDFPVGMYQLQLLGNSNATSQSFSIVR